MNVCCFFFFKLKGNFSINYISDNNGNILINIHIPYYFLPYSFNFLAYNFKEKKSVIRSIKSLKDKINNDPEKTAKGVDIFSQGIYKKTSLYIKNKSHEKPKYYESIGCFLGIHKTFNAVPEKTMTLMIESDGRLLKKYLNLVKIEKNYWGLWKKDIGYHYYVTSKKPEPGQDIKEICGWTLYQKDFVRYTEAGRIKETRVM
ncbi:hypothetical protein [Thiorhodospira sibirica]|uniref:hypothetical protein n=1 Tax=Thiorhodospira sibirica TaxID=154347 RepID=UPI00022C5E11|nr:hypothetical protein [Thiorhodospira sibirica]